MAKPVGSTASLRGVSQFKMKLARATGVLDKEVHKALTTIAQAVQTAAKQRVPVGSRLTGSKTPGRLRQSIRYQVKYRGKGLMMQARIGTNLQYGVFVEYGTERIAGGAVKRLGLGDDITDSMAITTWPALVMRGATGQQMPWLRPAAFGFRASAKCLLAETLRDVGGSFRGGA